MKNYTNHLHYLKGLKSEELINLFYADDQKAFDILMERHTACIKAFLHNRLHNHGAEAELLIMVMETVFETLRKRKYREENRFEHWLMGITRNCLYGYYRERNAIRERMDEEVIMEEIPEETNEEDSSEIVAEQLLRVLSPKVRKVVRMHAIEGEKYETIGRYMGINTDYVRQIYHRGLLKLKDVTGHGKKPGSNMDKCSN